MDVAGEAAPRELAVVDDVDADLDLLAHDLVDALADVARRAAPGRTAVRCVRAFMPSMISRVRIRLPLCVVRMRSVLRFTVVCYPF